MKYYLREMHQCSFKQVLLELYDDEIPPEPGEAHYGTLAHSVQQFNPDDKSYCITWYKGDISGSSDISRGCHVGICTEITEQEAQKILIKVKVSEIGKVFTDLVGDKYLMENSGEERERIKQVLLDYFPDGSRVEIDSDGIAYVNFPLFVKFTNNI